MRGTRAKALKREAIKQYQQTAMKSGIQVKTHTDITRTTYSDDTGKVAIIKRFSDMLLRDKLGKKAYEKISTIFGEWHPVTYKHIGFRRIYKDLKKEYKRIRRTNDGIYNT